MPSKWKQSATILGCLLALASHASLADAQEPLHARIDALIAARAGGLPVAAISDDAEFARRAYLDLAGRIPTVEEARVFLADGEADKRARLIDALLASRDYAARMQDAFSVMLLERLGDHPEWAKFLRLAFEQNRPWDQLVRQMLAPNADDEAIRGAAFFLSKRLENYGQNPVDLPALTRDVGRLFLGMDLQCAQCHDHPHIAGYKQLDFQGLYAFLGHATLRGDAGFPAVSEGLMTQKVAFMSVFVQEPHETGPRLPGGEEVAIVVFPMGEEYEKPGVPKFRPLAILAEQLPATGNTQFARNAVNRLWFHLLGRGLVHPLDLHHDANPPSHPELLDLLAAEFTAHAYDIKWLLREIALTQAYQRASLLPEGVADSPPELFLTQLEKPLSAEQLLAAMLQATGMAPAVAAADAEATGATDPSAAAATPAAGTTEPPPQTMAALRERFVAAFANPPREPEVEFAPSVRASLFLLNDGVVLGWLAPQPGNLVERLAAVADPAAAADELYLSVLSRLPTDEERAEVAEYLVRHADDRAKALSRLAWALLASTEFCVNH